MSEFVNPLSAEAREADDSILCKHGRFDTTVSVTRINSGVRFSLDVTIHCTECGLPFSFNGLKVGSDTAAASINADGTQAHLSISPGLGGTAVPRE